MLLCDKLINHCAFYTNKLYSIYSSFFYYITTSSCTFKQISRTGKEKVIVCFVFFYLFI
jgi:hypothetical protein